MLASRAEDWKRRWLQEGRLEGRLEGEAALLLRLLERRFGALPAGGSEIASPPPTLLRWRRGASAYWTPVV